MGGLGARFAAACGWLALVLACLAVPAGPAAAVPANAPPPRTGPVTLIETCRLLAPAGLDIAQMLPLLGRCDQPAPQSAVGTTWVAYRVPLSQSARYPRSWRLMIDNHRSRSVDAWLFGENGGHVHVHYDPADPDRAWGTAGYMSLPALLDARATRVVVRLEAAVGTTYVRSPWLMSALEFSSYDRNRALIFGAGVGMLLLTILFHSSLFFAIRRRFQLIYCAHVGLMLGYAICYSGLVRVIAPWLDAGTISRILGFTMAMAAGTGISFVVTYIERVALPGWQRRWAFLAALGSAVTALLYALAPDDQVAGAAMLANLAASNTLVATAVLVLTGCIRRYPSALTLLAGWTLPLIVSFLYPLRSMGIIQPDQLPDALLLAVMTLECLILSLPVAGRIRQLRLENERALERHQALEQQAQTDMLTGLANRRGFREALDRAALGLAPESLLGLLAIDIDHFKRVNDRYGHGTGDQILQHVADHVARVSGAGAIVARYGGEEFLVALTGHDLARAATLAERIRASVVSSFDPESLLPSVTISIGVAAGALSSLDMLVLEADRALYRAKDEGRNRVALARPEDRPGRQRAAA